MVLRNAWDNPKNVVQSLAKGFHVLQAFTAVEPELTLAAIARRAKLDNATTFRLLNTLAMLGYVHQVDGTRLYRLTFKCLELGFNAIARTELREAARPVLRALVGDVNEASSLGVLDGTDVMYVERVQTRLSRVGVEVQARIGTRIPAYCSALGLAMLAFLPPREQAWILNATERVKLTPRTMVGLGEIKARLAKVRKQGYAVVDQEVTAGLRTLAAPIFDIDGKVCAAVALVAPVLRMSLEDFSALAREPVIRAAVDISKAMQATGTHALPRARQA